MNPHDPRLKLITAAVDGELPLSARRRLKRLLRSDAQALAVYEALRNDKKRLAGYATPVLPVDFSRTVGLALAIPRQVEISRPVNSTVQPPFMTWNKALALSLVWLVGLAFLAYHLVPVREPAVDPEISVVSVPPRSGDTELGKGGAADLESPEFPLVVANSRVPDSWSEWLMPPSVPRSPITPVVNVPPLSGTSGVLADTSTTLPVLGAPAGRRNSLEELSLLLPASLGWNQLAEVPHTMAAVLGGSGPIQIDLPSSDPNRAMELLLGVLKESQRGVMVDALATDRLKRGNIRAHFLVLIEDVNAVQLGSMLDLLKKANEKQGIGKSGQFGPSLVFSSPDTMRKNLKAMVGQDLLSETLLKTSKPLIPRDLEGDTAKQVVQAVEGGRPSRLAAGPGSSVQPTVLVLAYSPYYPEIKSQPQSLEVRKYLESRPAGKVGAGRALLVFRGWSQ